MKFIDKILCGIGLHDYVWFERKWLGSYSRKNYYVQDKVCARERCNNRKTVIR